MELNKTDKKLIDQIIATNSKGARIHQYQAADISEFNHLDLGFYKRKTEEAGESGFEWLIDMESPSIDSVNNTRTAIRLLASKDRKIICALFHLKMSLFMRFIALIFRAGPLKVIEFETMFSDGTFVVTSTSKAQADIYQPPQITQHHVKEESFDKLFKIHQQNIKQHLSTSAERQVVALDSFDTIIDAQQKMDKYKMQHQQANHFLSQNQLPKSMRKDPDLLEAVLEYAKSQNPVFKQQQQDQLREFENTLAQSGFNFEEITVVPIEGFDNPAFAVKTDIANALKERQRLQEAFKNSHYPVITEISDYFEDFSAAVENMDVLSRFPFEAELEYRNQDVSVKYDPDTIISHGNTINLKKDIDSLVAEHCEFDESVSDELEYELQNIKNIFGSAPKSSAFSTLIKSGKLKNQIDLQKALISWVLKNHRDRAIEISKEDINSYAGIIDAKRYSNNPKKECAIILVPAKTMSAIPAFIHWEGSDQIGSAATCQLLQHWHTKYQAQLVAIEANSMEFKLPTPIKNMSEAFEMAVIHDALSPSMLAVAGNSVWQYALSLMRATTWNLWDTP